jgi:hypothetical protein
MTDLEKIEDWVKFHQVQMVAGTAIYTKELLAFIQSLKPKKEKLDFTGIYSKLQNRLKELTGKTNYRVQNKWNFIPSEKDLTLGLNKVSVKYKLKDVQKIQNLLLLHCERAVKEQFNYVPLLIYYISKNNVSQLASDMENTEEIKLGEIDTNNELTL